MKTRTMVLALTLMIMICGVVSAQVEENPQAVFVNMDEVTGADANGYIDPATLPATLAVPIRFFNVGGVRPSISNGYKFTGTGTATYTDLTALWNQSIPWDLNAAIRLMTFPYYFDVLATCYIAPDSTQTLVTADAIGVGFAGIAMQNGVGLPEDYDNLAYTVTLSGVDGEIGDQIIMDTTMWKPANYWIWIGVADPGPDWRGPYVFEIGTSDVAVVEGAEVPGSFSLSQNYPNPFNPTTTMAFNLPHRSNVEVVVYNILGQPVKTLVNEELAAGSYTVGWDGTSEAGRQVASGVYLCNMQAGDYRAKITMIMVK